MNVEQDITDLQLLKYCSHDVQLRVLVEQITRLHERVQELEESLEATSELIGVLHPDEEE